MNNIPCGAFFPKTDFGLKGLELFAYYIMYRYNEELWTSTTLAEAMGVTRVTSGKILAKLEDLGLVNKFVNQKAASRLGEKRIVYYIKPSLFLDGDRLYNITQKEDK